MKRSFDIEITPTPEELAEAFENMSGTEQAAFFSRIGSLVGKWSVPFAMQAQYITDSDALTDQGRAIMRTLGEYAERP
jgi:hypothetical protein